MTTVVALPVLYTATILTPGQCRGNLSTWRGVWTFALAGQPTDEPTDPEDGCEERDAAASAGCAVVLAHRTHATSSIEVRWFGMATREYYCGDIACICVSWRERYPKVPTATDMGVAPSAIGGAVTMVGSSLDDGHLALQHGLLIRDGYLLLGESGTNEKDNCIKLQLAAGTAIE